MMLQRKTPMKPGNPLTRRTPMPQVSAKRAAAMPKKAGQRDTGPDRGTRQLVKDREDWRCARCGKPLPNGEDQSIHHRRNRAMGGSSDPKINHPSNLVLICGSGTTQCHGEITRNEGRAQAMVDGWIVSTNGRIDPADVPVRHMQHGLVLLLDDGGFVSAAQSRRAA